MRISRLYIGILLLCGVSCGFISCGSQKQAVQKKHSVAKVKSKNTVKIPQLSYEQQRQFDYCFSEALRMRRLGEHSAAFEMYQHCLEIQPMDGRTLFDLASYYMSLNLKDKAEEYYKKAVECDPDNFWYKQILANLYEYDKSKYDEAIAVYEDLYKNFPQRNDVLFSLLSLYKKVNDVPNSIKILNEVEAIEGKSEELVMEKMLLLMKLGEKQKAIDEVKSLQNEYPNDSRYKVILAETYNSAGEPDKAYDLYREVLAEDGSNALARLSLANFYDAAGKDSLYEQQVDTILSLRSVESDAKVVLLRQIVIKNENATPDTAYVMSKFRKALDNTNLDNAGIPMLAVDYMQMKNMQESEVKPIVNKILEIEPDNSLARLQLLSYAVQKGDYKEVAAICELGIEYDPDNLTFYMYGGLAYDQMKQHEKALAVLKQGVEHIDDNSDANIASDMYSILADVYHDKNMLKECFEAYDASLKYNSDNIGTLNNYAYYLSLQNQQLDKAEEMSYKTIKKEPESSTFLDTYAWVLFMKARYTEAKIYIDQAIKYGGDESSGIIEHQGDIYYKCGETAKALQLWKKADSMGCDSKTLKKKIRLKKYIQ